MRHALSLVVSLCLLSTSASFGAQSRIDQEQPAVNNTGTAVPIGLVGTATKFGQRLAQVFTPAVVGYLTHVTVPVACEATATLTVSIQTVVGGLPSGVNIASEIIAGDRYPQYTAPYSTVPDAGFRLVQFFVPPHVVPGLDYAIVLAASGRCSILPAPAGDFYVSGRAYYDSPWSRGGGGWTPLAQSGPSDDLSFQTFVDGNPPIIID